MNTISIGVVDDERFIRESMVKVLNLIDDFEIVFELPSGEHLIKHLGNAQSLPDVLLLDIEMKYGMNGYRTAEQVKKNWPEISIIVLSSHIEEYAVLTMLRNGVKAFLGKDCGFFELEQAIRSASKDLIYQNQHVYGNRVRGSIELDQKNGGLTVVEGEVLDLLLQGYNYQECASRLNLSKRTIEKYRDSLFAKTKTQDRSQLIIFALLNGLYVAKGQ